MEIQFSVSWALLVGACCIVAFSEEEGVPSAGARISGYFEGRRFEDAEGTFEVGESGSVRVEEEFGSFSSAALSELGVTRKKKKRRKGTERPLLVRVTPPPGGSEWGDAFFGVQENISPPSEDGWGWGERAPPVPVTFPPRNDEGWGWEPPRDFCEDLSNRTITRVEDLEPEWRVVQVLSARRRLEVNPGDLFDPPLKLVPFKMNLQISENFKRTFIEEISIKFDEEAKNAGFSVTRNRFSTKKISARKSGLQIDGENTENVMQGAVSILKSTDRLVMPLRGKFDRNRYFREGLKRAKRAREMRKTASPVENFWRNDLLFASEIFDNLVDFESEEWEEETPTLVSLVEKRTLPDVDHSERTVLDAVFNFGLPASNFEFQEASETTEEWREVRRLRKQRSRLEKTREASSSEGGGVGWSSESSEEITRRRVSSEEFVRSRLKLHRTFGLESFVEAEERVQADYVVVQFLVCPTRTGNCTECPVDPGKFNSMMTNYRAGSSSGAARPKSGEKQPPLKSRLI